MKNNAVRNTFNRCSMLTTIVRQQFCNQWLQICSKIVGICSKIRYSLSVVRFHLLQCFTVAVHCLNLGKNNAPLILHIYIYLIYPTSPFHCSFINYFVFFCNFILSGQAYFFKILDDFALVQDSSILTINPVILQSLRFW